MSGHRPMPSGEVLQKLYAEGMKDKDIKEMFDLSDSMPRKLRKKYNIPYEPPKTRVVENAVRINLLRPVKLCPKCNNTRNAGCVPDGGMYCRYCHIEYDNGRNIVLRNVDGNKIGVIACHE